jgi:hypothetical protein
VDGQRIHASLKAHGVFKGFTAEAVLMFRVMVISETLGKKARQWTLQFSTRGSGMAVVLGNQG